MIQIIAGLKGKGKTKYLIQKANEEVKTASGNVVYLDKNNKHMYELSNKIRLINLSEFPVDTYDAFLGFISGVISQDHDLESMYLDSFITVSCVTEEYIGSTTLRLVASTKVMKMILPSWIVRFWGAMYAPFP